MKVKIRDTRQEVIRRTGLFFNDYAITGTSIKIYYCNRIIATIDLERMILEADIKTINKLGSLNENLKICRSLDMLACI